MEEKEIGEQLLEEEFDAQKGELGGALQTSSNSSLGKFKDADSLLEAYNNLQAEFTKKCQKLSELEKKYEHSTPVFENENWNNTVAEFFEKHSEAKQFSKAIAEKVFNDESLKTNPLALELAWAKVATENYKSPNEIIKDESFLENMVLNDETIRSKLLEKLVVGLTPAPPVITGNSGRNVSAKQAVNPKTLGEAKEILKTMF